jgi:hypothetical protein
MGTEILKLISTTAIQLLRTKRTVTKSHNSIDRCRRLIKESTIRCEKRKHEHKTDGIKLVQNATIDGTSRVHEREGAKFS